MLGKFFGSEFGKGLVAGAAKGFEKGFADDIKRTKDNVDRLVLTAYEGGVESKKEFDKVYKENRKIVDKIIANLGGAQGADNPRAIDAAQGLISDQGLDGALKYSENLSEQFQLLGRDPIKSLGLAQRTNHSTPLTADLLTKSTVPPVAIPNIKELAKDADVGIMKFFGDDDYTSSTVESQAKALLRARGIDPNARRIVNELKFNNTIKAKKQRKMEYEIANLIVTAPEATGRFFVLDTFESNSLSKMSLIIQPADLINTEPKKKRNRK